ncbi:MAG: hypothetical protein HQ538_06785 [Parcubacteria group bacterium]|nr:hypothetical protein [Parcubacteria group bacterium]
MKTLNFNNKINSYLDSNPSLQNNDLEILLTMDLLYTETPSDLEFFREIYTHLDPHVIHNSQEGITFLKISQQDKGEEELKKDLNRYLNIKFNDIENLRSYQENMVFFKKYSIHASNALEEILSNALLPDKIVNILNEKEEVRECYDIYQMLKLYKNTSSKRIKFEILRKLGLIVLIARINRSIHVEYLDHEMKKVITSFNKGLGFNNARRGLCYLWIDHKNKIQYTKDKDKAKHFYSKEIIARKELALDVHPMQNLNYHTFETHSGNQIINFECRNKFKKNDQIYYASFIEKMIRKNLEFPDQIHDIIGIKIIVKREDDIEKIIYDLENFLGGSSTRKREKNTYHKFNKRILNKYSSDDYYVWKAIYDITLSHSSVEQVKKLIAMTNDNKKAQLELEKRLKYFLNNPQDFVIEVQLQDLETYLLSITRGSPTDHRLLKMSQIRNSSFYKLFPQEIYESEVMNLKLQILNNSQIEF